MRTLTEAEIAKEVSDIRSRPWPLGTVLFVKSLYEDHKNGNIFKNDRGEIVPLVTETPVILGEEDVQHTLIATKWTLCGLLTLLDTKWKGVLILAAILFFRSLQPSLMKMKLKTPVGEVDMSKIAVLPGASYENPVQTDEPARKTERAP